MLRQSLFAQKDAEYKKINEDPENTFTVGHNKFSTWTEDEIKRMLIQTPFKRNMTDLSKVKKLPTLDIPDTIDWRS